VTFKLTEVRWWVKCQKGHGKRTFKCELDFLERIRKRICIAETAERLEYVSNDDSYILERY
jgi:hypothetical protein